MIWIVWICQSVVSGPRNSERDDKVPTTTKLERVIYADCSSRRWRLPSRAVTGTIAFGVQERHLTTLSTLRVIPRGLWLYPVSHHLASGQGASGSCRKQSGCVGGAFSQGQYSGFGVNQKSERQVKGFLQSRLNGRTAF